MALPTCLAELTGWAVSGCVSHRPCGAGTFLRPTGQPCVLGQDGWAGQGHHDQLPEGFMHQAPATCLCWDQRQQTTMDSQSCKCQNNTSGGTNKLFLCIGVAMHNWLRVLPCSATKGLLKHPEHSETTWGISPVFQKAGEGICQCPGGAADCQIMLLLSKEQTSECQAQRSCSERSWFCWSHSQVWLCLCH